MIKLTKFITIPIMAVIGMLSLQGCEKKADRAYALLPEQAEPEMDITNYGTLSVNRENGGGKEGGEGSLKLVDNDFNSKFLINPYVDDLYFELAFPGGIAVNAYILVSGNDAPGRDPKTWKLLGSNDRSDWVVVHEKADFLFTGRNQVARFDFSNEVQYKYYRVRVEQIRDGSGLFQLSEWRLFYTPKSTTN